MKRGDRATDRRQRPAQCTGTGSRRSGARVANAFTAELTRSGGTVVTQGNYTYDVNDRSKTDIEATITRHWASTRRAAASNACGNSLAARCSSGLSRGPTRTRYSSRASIRRPSEIKPQLFFYEAGNLPTYVTRDGVDTGSRDISDLEGMRVLATPWNSTASVRLRTCAPPRSPAGARRGRANRASLHSATTRRRLPLPCAAVPRPGRSPASPAACN